MKRNIIEVYAEKCILTIVNKTSCDKGGACANEKQKRCNQISSNITLVQITLLRDMPRADILKF